MPHQKRKNSFQKPKSIKLCDVMPPFGNPIFRLSGMTADRVKKQGTPYKPKSKRKPRKKNLNT